MGLARCSVPQSSKGSANKSTGGSTYKKSKGMSKGLAGDEKAGRDEVLNALVGTEVEVASIGIYGTRFWKIFSHNFVMIDVNHAKRGNYTDKRVSLIKAEKGIENLRGKIDLSVCEEFDGEGERHKVELKGCGKISGEKLLEILEKYHTPSYSLFQHNCWTYADDTFRRLIVEFANLPDTNSETKERLRKYLKDLPRFKSPSLAFKEFLAFLSVSLFTAGVIYSLIAPLPSTYLGLVVHFCWVAFSLTYEALRPGLGRSFDWLLSAYILKL